ncbi:hypothetical protein BY996DRAFT_6412496 [Phakopsora pachyrhizi]|nr:hypothetical protein BY996DRAFT_6412496 [Phakopsora pachyrhizi]
MSQIVGSWSLRLPLLLLLCLSPEDCFMSWDGVHCIKSDQDKYRLIYKTNRLEELTSQMIANGWVKVEIVGNELVDFDTNLFLVLIITSTIFITAAVFNHQGFW